MNITYIHHSSFLIELDHIYLLFDYVGGSLPAPDAGKKLYVFVSHAHKDHFSPVIFELAGRYQDVCYIISDDVPENQIPGEFSRRTGRIRAGGVLKREAGGLRITAFHSTDRGVAFLLDYRGQVIYHAGDLNNWHWNGEPDEWNRNMEKDYLAELEKIKAGGRRPDIAFLVLDGRQEDWFWTGFHQFMETIGAGLAFPMHFWGDYSVIGRLKQLPCAASYRRRIADIREPGQQFTYHKEEN